jgi:1,4-alpha-glucan branching enzyme
MSDTPVPGNECSLLSEDDLYMFNEGTHARLYEKLGAHPVVSRSLSGTYFAVWAPNAKHVTVIGDFNGWDKTASNLHPRGCSGIWENFIPGVGKGALYKYHIVSRSRLRVLHR